MKKLVLEFNISQKTTYGNGAGTKTKLITSRDNGDTIEGKIIINSIEDNIDEFFQHGKYEVTFTKIEE